MNNLTPGVQTTEFWTAIIGQVVLLLSLIGIVPSQNVDDITKAVTIIVGGVIAIISAVTYIWSRVHLKSRQMELSTTQAVVNAAANTNTNPVVPATETLTPPSGN